MPVGYDVDHTIWSYTDSDDTEDGTYTEDRKFLICLLDFIFHEITAHTAHIAMGTVADIAAIGMDTGIAEPVEEFPVEECPVEESAGEETSASHSNTMSKKIGVIPSDCHFDNKIIQYWELCGTIKERTCMVQHTHNILGIERTCNRRDLCVS